MYISKNQYFYVKANLEEVMDITFELRELNEKNISRLYDDVVDCGSNIEDIIVSEVVFYHCLWRKIGSLPEYSINQIKDITRDILLSNKKFSNLNNEEYTDFMKITQELYTSKIDVFNNE